MRYQNVVILTGAGISAESGVKTFRDSGGLWEDHRIEEVATPEGFRANPDLVQHFYNQRRAQLKDVEPNAAHIALARLERELDGTVTVITQNVDDLHERGGMSRVIHMHGELRSVKCTECGARHRWEEDCGQEIPCPACDTAPGLRPDIVWFGEMPYQMDRIATLLGRADLFVSIGTSGNVYPAAGFVADVRYYGQAHTVEINLEPSESATLFAECRHGPAATLVPVFVDEILNT